MCVTRAEPWCMLPRPTGRGLSLRPHLGESPAMSTPKRNAKRNTNRNVSPILCLSLALGLLAGCASRSEPPPPETFQMSSHEEGVPGGVAVDAVEVSARVVEVDHEERTALLRGPEGEEFPIRVGPEVVNFDRVEAGDLVRAIVVREIVVGLADPAAPQADAAAEGVALAPVGAAPGGVVARTVRVTGTVTAIDPEARTATLRFADGSTRTFPVRPDIDLEAHSVGERVSFQVTESVALDVVKP